MRTRSLRADDGSAVVEFIALTAVIVIPLVYLVFTLASIQSATYAATGAARQAGRTFVSRPDDDSARFSGQAAAELVFEDFGVAGDGSLAIDCEFDPCLSPEGRVTIEVTVRVPLPLIPDFARDVVPVEIPITATHVATVDRFKDAP